MISQGGAGAGNLGFEGVGIAVTISFSVYPGSNPSRSRAKDVYIA
jgi:hypothetical protein